MPLSPSNVQRYGLAGPSHAPIVVRTIPREISGSRKGVAGYQTETVVVGLHRAM